MQHWFWISCGKFQWTKVNEYELRWIIICCWKGRLPVMNVFIKDLKDQSVEKSHFTKLGANLLKCWEQLRWINDGSKQQIDLTCLVMKRCLFPAWKDVNLTRAKDFFPKRKLVLLEVAMLTSTTLARSKNNLVQEHLWSQNPLYWSILIVSLSILFPSTADGFPMWLHDNGCICPKPQFRTPRKKGKNII